jgi:hypothetical protein
MNAMLPRGENPRHHLTIEKFVINEEDSSTVGFVILPDGSTAHRREISVMGGTPITNQGAGFGVPAFTQLWNCQKNACQFCFFYVPVPAKLTFCGLPPPLSVTETAADRVPAAVGLNVTLIKQLAPEATLFPQVFV